jgi:CHAD domain-containing protein
MRMKSPRVKKVAQNSEDTLKMPVELRVTEKSEMTLDGEMICPTFVLREQVTAFEAAMAIVLAGPEKKAVHKLRASTRRVEAQLLLLSLMGHGEKTFGKPYRKLLKEVRRACGRARDCDVELDLLDELVAGLVAGESDELRAQVETLRLTLIAKRERRANELTKDLQGHARKLPARLEALLKALKPAEDERLEPARLEERTQTTPTRKRMWVLKIPGKKLCMRCESGPNWRVFCLKVEAVGCRSRPGSLNPCRTAAAYGTTC